MFWHKYFDSDYHDWMEGQKRLLHKYRWLTVIHPYYNTVLQIR